MTVESTTSEISAVGDGVQTIYPYDFIVFDATTLFYFFDGVEQVITPTVSGLGNAAGGDVTFETAPASGVTVTIIRILPLTQDTDYQPFSAFDSETVERNFDDLTLQVQQVASELELRVVRIPIGFPGVSTDLPPPEASKVIGWNGTADQLTNFDLIDIVQRVILVSTEPDGVQTGIGDAWVTAGDSVTASITIAFYGTVSYLLADVANPQDDVSWQAIGTIQTYTDLIALGSVVGYWPALSVDNRALLTPGDIVVGESTNTGRSLYQLRFAGDSSVDPASDTYDDSGIGTDWIDLFINNAPVSADEFTNLQDSITAFAIALIDAGFFIGFATSWLTTSSTQVGFGSCGGFGGVGAVQLLRVDTPFEKNIGLTWVQGNANGGLADTATLTKDTWYTKHVLGAVFVSPAVPSDWGFSAATDLDGSALLADANVTTEGYNSVRQFGWEYVNDQGANGEIAEYRIEDNNRVLWIEPVVVLAPLTNPSVGNPFWIPSNVAGELLTFQAPPGSTAIVEFYSQLGNNALFMQFARIWPTIDGDMAVTNANANIQGYTQGPVNIASARLSAQNNYLLIKVDENSQVYTRAQAGQTTMNVSCNVLGYIWEGQAHS